MKKILTLILLYFAQNISAQILTQDGRIIEDKSTNKTPAGTENNTESKSNFKGGDNVYNVSGIDIKPEFPGGIDAFNKFVSQNFKLSKENPELKGKIYMTFVIEKDGSLSDIKVMRDIGYNTGAEAIRVLKISPKWTPAKHNNNLIRVLYALPLLINYPTL